MANIRRVLKDRWKPNDTSTRIVEVLWFDAMSVAGDVWGLHEEAHSAAPAKTITLGYVVNETDEYITLVGLINHHHISHGICIPKGMIREIRELSVCNRG
jgi:hypothetical protein